MATAADIIADALAEIGVLAAGETLSAEDGASGLRALNRMIDAWKAERVFLFGMNRATWAITAGTASYVIGTGAVVNVARPDVIDSFRFYDTAITEITEIPLRMMTDADYEARGTPALQAKYPQAVYFNQSYPTAEAKAFITLWPTPTATTLVGVVYYPGSISEFASLATSYVFTAGYDRMVAKNLALELAPQYGAEPSAILQRQALDSMAVVARSNKRLQEVRFSPDAGMGYGTYDIITDSQ